MVLRVVSVPEVPRVVFVPEGLRVVFVPEGLRVVFVPEVPWAGSGTQARQEYSRHHPVRSWHPSDDKQKLTPPSQALHERVAYIGHP